MVRGERGAGCSSKKSYTEKQIGKRSRELMKRILVAEDNLANRELLREILEARQYAVVKAMPEERHSPR
jgi:PleD family two-component response regulator